VILQQKEFKGKPIIPGLYALRKIVDRQFDYHLKIDKKPVEDYATVSEEFQSRLKTLIEEIFNPEIPFQKVEDKTKCEYCGFKMICHR
jgi:CRISPR/Cas system-associated exonuclease Cas4 (RecB family)